MITTDIEWNVPVRSAVSALRLRVLASKIRIVFKWVLVSSRSCRHFSIVTQYLIRTSWVYGDLWPDYVQPYEDIGVLDGHEGYNSVNVLCEVFRRDTILVVVARRSHLILMPLWQEHLQI